MGKETGIAVLLKAVTIDLGYGYKINLNFSDDPQGAMWFQLNIQMLYLKILREKISKQFACCHRYLKTERKKKKSNSKGTRDGSSYIILRERLRKEKNIWNYF